jgi:hypothetical protein
VIEENDSKIKEEQKKLSDGEEFVSVRIALFLAPYLRHSKN